MRIYLHLLLVITTAFGFPQEGTVADDPKMKEFLACAEKCSEEDKKHNYLCVDSPNGGYVNRCDFTCAKMMFEDRRNEKEVECKPGTFEHCWNIECSPEEKVVKEGIWWCEKDKDSHRISSVCTLKCIGGTYRKDLSYLTC